MKKLAKEIWIVAAKRTPFGTLSGTLKGVSAIDLAVREGQGAAITHADRLLVTPLRPAALLAAAEAHRLPVTTAGA